MGKVLRELLAACRLNLSSLGARRGGAAITVSGFAAVVGILIAALAVATGFRGAFEHAGSPDVAIVLNSGVNTEVYSSLSADQVHAIAQAPGVARIGGKPAVAPEVMASFDVRYAVSGTRATIVFRGVTPMAFRIHPAVHIVRGRMFRPGLDEIVVGEGAADRFHGLTLGSQVTQGGRRWSVVGIFDAGDTLYGSEVWTDAHVLQDVAHSGNKYSADIVKLASPQAFDTFEHALESNPQLSVSVWQERAYYARQSRRIAQFITWIGGAVALLMGIGAIFGALNTMYSAVAARTREIATLRALGFGRGAVLASVLAESLLLGLAGAAIGSTLAYFGFNNLHASTVNYNGSIDTATQVAFTLAVTPAVLMIGAAWAVAMGFVGGLFPAIRAARLPVATALRDI
jgi:putative ABC transport system permease protein